MGIKLMAFKGTSLTSRIIQLATRGKYSHIGYLPPVEMQVDTDLVGPLIIEAWKGMVRLDDVRCSHNPKTKFEVFHLPCNQWQADNFMSFASDKIYKPYDYLAIMNFILPKRMKFNRKDQYFCSELIAEGLNICFGTGLTPYKESPSDIVRALQGLGGNMVACGEIEDIGRFSHIILHHMD